MLPLRNVLIFTHRRVGPKQQSTALHGSYSSFHPPINFSSIVCIKSYHIRRFLTTATNNSAKVPHRGDTNVPSVSSYGKQRKKWKTAESIMLNEDQGVLSASQSGGSADRGIRCLDESDLQESKIVNAISWKRTINGTLISNLQREGKTSSADLSEVRSIFHEIMQTIDELETLITPAMSTINNEGKGIFSLDAQSSYIIEWGEYISKVVQLRKGITRVTKNLEEEIDEIPKKIFIDSIKKEIKRIKLFDFFDYYIQTQPLALIREALLLTNLLKPEMEEGLKISSTIISRHTSQSRFTYYMYVFIKCLAFVSSFDGGIIRHIIQFTKQYCNWPNILLQLQPTWIRMVQSLSSPPYLLYKKSTPGDLRGTKNIIEFPTAHEVLGVLRVIEHLELANKRTMLSNQFQLPSSPHQMSDIPNTNSVFSKNILQSEVSTPVSQKCSETYISKNYLHSCFIQPELTSFTHNELLLGFKWKDTLRQLFSSDNWVWHTANPRQLVEVLSIGYRLLLLIPRDLNYLTLRLSNMAQFIGQSSLSKDWSLCSKTSKNYYKKDTLSTHHLSTNAQWTVLSLSECRTLLLLLFMIHSTYNHFHQRVARSNINSKLLNHLSRHVTSSIPSVINVTDLIIFTTVFVNLSIESPELRQCLIRTMQRGRLHELTAEYFLTALCHFNYLRIQRSDETHIFITQYVKRNLDQFTPAQLLLLLRYIPKHLTTSRELYIALIPPMQRMTQIFIGKKRQLDNGELFLGQFAHSSSQSATVIDINAQATDGFSNPASQFCTNPPECKIETSLYDIVSAIDSLRPLVGNSLIPLQLFHRFVNNGLSLANLEGLLRPSLEKSNLIKDSLDIRLLSFSHLSQLLIDFTTWNWRGIPILISALHYVVMSNAITNLLHESIKLRLSVLEILSTYKLSSKDYRSHHQSQLKECLTYSILPHCNGLTPKEAKRFLRLSLHSKVKELFLQSQNIYSTITYCLPGENSGNSKGFNNLLCKTTSAEKLSTSFGTVQNFESSPEFQAISTDKAKTFINGRMKKRKSTNTKKETLTNIRPTANRYRDSIPHEIDSLYLPDQSSSEPQETKQYQRRGSLRRDQLVDQIIEECSSQWKFQIQLVDDALKTNKNAKDHK